MFTSYLARMQVRDVMWNCCYNQLMTILVDDISALEYYLHHPVTPVMHDRAQLVVQGGDVSNIKTGARVFSTPLSGYRLQHASSRNA